MRRGTLRLRAAAAAIGILAAACASSEEPGAGGSPGGARAELEATVASFDLSAETPQRFIVGLSLFDPSGQLAVTGGSVDLSFSFLGEEQASGSEHYRDATATFLPIPGAPGPFGDQPVAGSAASGRGVYAVYDLEFDRAGFWEAEVSADLRDHGVMTATAAFEVLPEPLVPAIGDRAPRSENLTLDTKDAPEEAIDSRAATGGIPDPELHGTTVADALRAGHPALVVIATPVYCVSKFCGPVTDVVQELAGEYEDRAEFIHIELWRDFQGSVINKAAADWILREDEQGQPVLLEPWVFLVDADGRIAARWDNVATRQEMEPYLQDLPSLGS